MELNDAIKTRRSIRKFKSTPVSDQHIQDLLEAARLAPTGSNLQPSRFVIIKNPEVRAKLNDCTPLPFVASAPVVLACCVDTQAFASSTRRYVELREAGAFVDTPLNEPSDSTSLKKRNLDEAAAKAYLSLNVAIAIDHITLRAVDLGLGTCWIMMFDQDKTKALLELDERYSIVALLPIGYPDQSPGPRPRLELNKLILKEL